ncbi:cytochrome P450 [Streptomyces sp. NPDC059003]|uniref:cytochrome P450 n=1 Tax=Streptomyces sp. NPDC059003 TaxID=3346691 RepID=UPI0036789836
MVRDPWTFLKSLPAHGEVVRIRLGPMSVAVICDPELTRQALADDRVFDKGGPLADRAREVLGDGLGICPHRTHRRLRRLAQPAFHPGRLPSYAQTMTACIEEATGSWKPGQTLDVPTEMMTLTSLVTTATLFSSSLPTAAYGQLVNDTKTIANGIVQRTMLISPLDRLPTPGNRAFLLARTRLRQACDQIITERRVSGTDRGDLLSALIAAHDPADNSNMSDAELSGTILTIFLAGTDTTASTLAWALHLLARRPKIEQRVHAEVDAVLHGTPAAYAALPRLELTQRVIMETLRLHPPIWFLTRTVTRDTRLGGYRLPAGSSIAYSPYLIHRNAELYTNPERFDPDRWDPKHSQPPRHAFLPFVTGARKCIGDSFAMIEATLALATITARWRLKHVPGHRPVRPALGAVLVPRELRMQATPRHPCGVS